MNTRDIVYIALFAALTAALGLFPPIVIPLAAGVPITAQTLGVMLAGGILGSKRGALAMLLLLLLVAIGLPLLSGGRGGPTVFVGPSAGFLIGWVAAAFVVGWLTERFWSRVNVALACSFNLLGGIVVLYAFGVPWLAYTAELSLLNAAIGSAAFIPGDVMKSVLAALIVVTVKRAYPLVKPAGSLA